MLGTEEPPLAIVCDPAGDPPGISWFSVVISDAPPLDESPDVQPLRGHRLIEEFPELGRGLDLTLEVGGSVERDGEWRPATDPAHLVAPRPRSRPEEVDKRRRRLLDQSD